MGGAFEFCREVAGAIEEPLAGTASYAEQFIFISWPKTAWHSDPLESKGLPADLVHWFKRQAPQYGKLALRLIHQPQASAERIQIFIYPGATHYAEVPPTELSHVLESHYRGQADLRYRRPPLQIPQFFLCTHGKRDRCCAKFGQVFAQALRDSLAVQPLALDFWESSHLGGHRFAATGVIFPSGHMYGRLEEADLAPLLHCLIEGKVYAPAYRGQSFLPPVEQVAEAYAQAYAFEHGWKAEVSVSHPVRDLSGHTLAIVHLTGEATTHVMKLILQTQDYTGPASCGEPNESRARWVVTYAEDASD